MRLGEGAEAVAAAGEILNTAGELGAEDSAILTGVPQNGECSEN